MIKRKILMVTLPLIGVATIVGSGFSAWYFNETPVTTSATVGVEVTEKHVATGTLTHTLPVGAKLVLDQGGPTNATVLNQLIYVAKSDGTKISSFDLSFTIPTLTAANLLSSHVKAKITLVPTVNTTLAKYVDVTTSKLSITQEITFTDEETYTGWTKTTSDGNHVYTTTIALPASNETGSPFIYKATTVTDDVYEGGKPVKETQYDTMKGDLSTEGFVGISFAGNVEFIPY